MSSHCPSISWLVSHAGYASIPYLDLSLSLEPSPGGWTLVHGIYRKPLNAYLYVPGQSGHARHHLDGVVASEVARIIRNHPGKGQAEEIEFFLQKFSHRGHDKAKMRKIAATVVHRQKQQLNNVHRRNGSTHRSTFLKVEHSSGLHRRGLLRLLSQHVSLLAACHSSTVRLSLKPQPNLLLRNLKRNFGSGSRH